MVYMHMHHMESSQNFYYVHERLLNFSNILKKVFKKLQTYLPSFATLDFPTFISLDFPCLVPSYTVIDFSSLFTTFFRTENPMSPIVGLKMNFPSSFFITK